MHRSEQENRQEIRIQGSAVSEGIAIGTAFFLSVASSIKEDIPEFPITLKEVDREIARYRQALFSSKQDLRQLQLDLALEGSNDALNLIDSHIHMLEDPLITTQIEEKIRLMLRNTEAVFRTAINEFEVRFSQRSDSFFQQRLIDVQDVSKRILGHLCNQPQSPFSEIPEGSIVFAKELDPSQTASAQSSKIGAFVTQMSGGHSHAALIARAKGIPYIASVDVQAIEMLNGSIVIVDGATGIIIVHPQMDTLKHYESLQKQMVTRHQLLEKESHLFAETMDGYPIRICANLGNPDELDRFPYPISGVGLFRTEYLFMKKGTYFPTEEEQSKAYLKLLQKTKDLPVTLRFFDVGGDKNPELFTDMEKEPNPVLGCRGIRFLLKNTHLFKTQIRAILKVAQAGNVKLLIPLVSDIYEVIESKRLIEETRQELLNEGYEHVPSLPLGCMIEVPSSVMICDALAARCDFLSIGTNDLVQYTLGVDRGNPKLNHLMHPVHPSMIRMIKMVVTEGKRQNKPVSICGESATNKLIIPLFIGLGLQDFSCSPRYIPVIKRCLRQCSIVKCFELARYILTLDDPHLILDVLIKESQRLEG